MKIEDITVEQDAVVTRVCRILYFRHKHHLGPYDEGDLYGRFYDSKIEHFYPEKGYSWDGFVWMSVDNDIKDIKRKIATQATHRKGLESKVNPSADILEVEILGYDGSHVEEGLYEKQTKDVRVSMPECYDCDEVDLSTVIRLTSRSDLYKPMRHYIAKGEYGNVKRIIKEHLSQCGFSRDTIDAMEDDIKKCAHAVIGQRRKWDRTRNENKQK